MIARLAPLIVLLAALPGGPQKSRPSQTSSSPRVLFIGNSLTAANGLPRLVETLSAAAGRTIRTRAVTFNNFSLEDHWTQGDAKRAIAQGGWTFVVLQQGPSALPESQVLLRRFARLFADEAHRVGATTALYMVWPSKARFSDFDGVSTSYARAAKDVEGILLPVGDAWRAAWRRHPDLDLYTHDNFHPSPLGTYLAALVMVERFTGASPTELPPPPGTDLTADQVTSLQAAAHEANMEAGTAR